VIGARRHVVVLCGEYEWAPFPYWCGPAELTPENLELMHHSLLPRIPWDRVLWTNQRDDATRMALEDAVGFAVGATDAVVGSLAVTVRDVGEVMADVG
jgi:hypothetical protein